jgi:hypothetical protein
LEIIENKILNYTVREFKDMLNRSSSRMTNTKFKHFENALSYIDTENDLGEVILSFVPSLREWKGNYSGKLLKTIQRIFSLRFQTPKRVERQERIRGYRDHGSMSSQSEKARKEANSYQLLSPQLEQVLRFIEETGASIPYALEIFRMADRE